MILYYKRLREATNEYKKSKNILKDVIFSFNFELKENKKELQKQKNEVLLNKKLLKEKETVEKTWKKDLDKIKIRINENSLIKKDENFSYLLEEKIEEIKNQQEHLKRKIDTLGLMEDKKENEITKIKSGIPIKREKIFSSLTETELKILEFLMSGGKSVPKIKEEIDLTREHTSRLMKSLYVRGYIERKTDKMPYFYSIKKEMQKFIEKNN
jgi:hypothetical protein